MFLRTVKLVEWLAQDLKGCGCLLKRSELVGAFMPTMDQLSFQQISGKC